MAFKTQTITRGVVLVAMVGALAACGGTASPATPPAAASSPAGNPTRTNAEANAAGDIPDSQAFVEYASTAHGFTLKVPEGWAETAAGGLTSFSDKYNSISIESISATTAPTVATATSTELPAIKSTLTGFTAGAVSTVPRSAGTAVLITYQADSPPNSVTGKVVPQAIERYEFWKNGQEVVLTLSAPAGADNVDPWKTVTDSFRWTS